MNKILTIQDLHTVCGKPIDRLKFRAYMGDLKDEYEMIILHIGEEHENSGITLHSYGQYADEVWIIRQIGPATCIKNRNRATPYDEMFF